MHRSIGRSASGSGVAELLAPGDRLAAALTAADRLAWNGLVAEIAALAGLLRDQLSGDPHHGARVTRLHSLVANLPVLEAPGAGEGAS